MGYGRDVDEIIRLENDQLWIYDAVIFPGTYKIHLGVFVEQVPQIGPIIVITPIPTGIAYLCQVTVIRLLCPDIDIFRIPTLHDAPHAFANQDGRVGRDFLCWEKTDESGRDIYMIDESDELAKVLHIKEAILLQILV
jgi:hypothetical protein